MDNLTAKSSVDSQSYVGHNDAYGIFSDFTNGCLDNLALALLSRCPHRTEQRTLLPNIFNGVDIFDTRMKIEALGFRNVSPQSKPNIDLTINIQLISESARVL